MVDMDPELFETDLRPALSAGRFQQLNLLAQLFPTGNRADIPLNRLPLSVGRDPASDIIIDHPSISRAHARLEAASPSVLQVVNLKSKNGLFLNQRPVLAKAELALGDVLRLGHVVFKLLQRSLDALTEDPRPDPQSPLVGGPSLDPIRRQIQLLGPTTLRIMVTGESGTGKEVVARELHRASNRGGAFVAVNCAALPEALVESELFGFSRGAFTGASQDKPGLFEVAQGGTLFLDEVTELPLASQAKLLRVVETGEIRRVGAVQQRRVDCRIISATNHDLAHDMEQQRFRADLAARLAEAELRLPPLRERMEDLPRLMEHLCRRSGYALQLAPEAAEVLACHSWPLNVRELDNAVRFLGAVSQGQEVTLAMLPGPLLSGALRGDALGRHQLPASPSADRSRIEQVLEALRYDRGNIRATSQRLGVSRTFIYRCLDRSGMTPGDFR